MSCHHHDCQQGRRCPCPQACEVPLEEESFTPIAKAIYTVAVGIAVAVVIGSILLQVSLL